MQSLYVMAQKVITCRRHVRSAVSRPSFPSTACAAPRPCLLLRLTVIIAVSPAHPP